MVNEFFNKGKYIVSKLSDQTIIVPDIEFSLPLYVIDILKLTESTITSAKVIKTSGRDSVVLPTVCTVADNVVTANIAIASWNGIDSLQLQLVIGDGTIHLPLFTKGT